MAEVTKRLSTQVWDELIQNYRASGLTAAQWCETNGFKINQLRWQITKRQKLNMNDQTIKWMPLQTDSIPSESSSITVKIGKAEISVSEGFNKGLFAEVVHSLLTLC